MTRFLIILTISLCPLTFTGCSFFAERDATLTWTDQQLYNAGREALTDGDYQTAIKHYEMLEARYPFGELAQQGLLDIIYAYYRYDEPESALAAADRFIKNYPRHERVDYAYYMKGLVHFHAQSGMFDRFLSLDKSQRDQAAALDSFAAFGELLNRFPDSQYSEDARQRMLFLRNNIAAYELNVAQYYMVRGAYLAAVNRAKKVVESYQRTPAVPNALILLARAYKALGMKDLSQAALDVLRLNYPDHEGIKEIEKIEVRG